VTIREWLHGIVGNDNDAEPTVDDEAEEPVAYFSEPMAIAKEENGGTQ
jgi:hypothetical protein